ncbi:MAG: tetratricopeptide repeat protein [Phycisphaerae bacterium]
MASRKANKGKATRDKKRRDKRLQQTSEPWATPVNGALSAIIIAGCVYLFTPTGEAETATQQTKQAATQRTITPFPAPQAMTAADGAPMATFDHPALAAWCQEVDLPVPPDLGQLEPTVARSLESGYRNLIKNRTDTTLGKLGMIYEALDCHDTAATYFQRANKHNPRAFKWPYYLACIYQLTGDNARARTYFLAAEKINPTYPVLHARIGQLDLERNALEDAQRRFTRYSQLSPDDALGYAGLGRVALQRNDTATALRQLQLAVSKGPGDFQSHFYLAEALNADGQQELAKQLYERAAALPQGKWFFMRDPLDQELHQTTGSLQSLITKFEQLNAAGRYAEMIDLAQKILRQRPRDTMMWTNLGNAYLKMKRFDEAHEALDNAEKIQAGLAQTLVVRAAVLLGQTNWKEAADVAAQTIAIRSSSAEAHTIYGRALFMMGNFDEAEPAMARALQMDDSNAGNHYVHGEILLRLQRPDEARRSFERALKLNPQLKEARQRLEQLQ